MAGFEQWVDQSEEWKHFVGCHLGEQVVRWSQALHGRLDWFGYECRKGRSVNRVGMTSEFDSFAESERDS
jgi:hypothetical protein